MSSANVSRGRKIAATVAAIIGVAAVVGAWAVHEALTATVNLFGHSPTVVEQLDSMTRSPLADGSGIVWHGREVARLRWQRRVSGVEGLLDSLRVYQGEWTEAGPPLGVGRLAARLLSTEGRPPLLRVSLVDSAMVRSSDPIGQVWVGGTVLWLFSRKTAVDSCTAPATVRDSSVAAIRIGMSVGQLRRSCTVVGSARRPAPGDTEPERLLLVEIGADTVRVSVFSDTVDAIYITSPGIAAEGVRVGDPLTRLLQTPGVVGQVGEEAVAVVLPAHCGIWFVVDGIRGLETGDELNRVQLRRYPDARVSEIQVIGCLGPDPERG